MSDTSGWSEEREDQLQAILAARRRDCPLRRCRRWKRCAGKERPEPACAAADRHPVPAELELSLRRHMAFRAKARLMQMWNDPATRARMEAEEGEKWRRMRAGLPAVEPEAPAPPAWTKRPRIRQL